MFTLKAKVRKNNNSTFGLTPLLIFTPILSFGILVASCKYSDPFYTNADQQNYR